MAHQRSKEALLRRDQRHAAKQFMWDQSYQDTIKAETINRCSFEHILGYLGKKYGMVESGVVPCAAFMGCVLTDGRGEGAFQK